MFGQRPFAPLSMLSLGLPENCRYLAGGQSLIPSLSLRLQAPSVLIDISRIEELRGIALSEGRLRIGALTPHVEMLKTPEIARHAPPVPACSTARRASSNSQQGYYRRQHSFGRSGGRVSRGGLGGGRGI